MVEAVWHGFELDPHRHCVVALRTACAAFAVLRARRRCTLQGVLTTSGNLRVLLLCCSSFSLSGRRGAQVATNRAAGVAEAIRGQPTAPAAPPARAGRTCSGSAQARERRTNQVTKTMTTACLSAAVPAQRPRRRATLASKSGTAATAAAAPGRVRQVASVVADTVHRSPVLAAQAAVITTQEYEGITTLADTVHST